MFRDVSGMGLRANDSVQSRGGAGPARRVPRQKPTQVAGSSGSAVDDRPEQGRGLLEVCL